MSTLVSTDWLSDHLGDENLIVMHSSYFLGVPGHSPYESYMKGHIPGARLFEIDEVCDHANPLPHMIPSPEFFSGAVSTLGISNDSHVVVYDDGGVQPAFRVWWTFKAMGHEKVSVLNGGLMKWHSEDRPIIQDIPEITPSNYQASLASKVTDKAGVLANIESGECEVLDARGPGRFKGEDGDPRSGVKSGHIPGSKNLYYGFLFNEDGTLKSTDELKILIENAGLQKGKPVITTCGSGVTACILYHVLDQVGFQDLKVYDGSWAEWGTAPDTPVETGKTD